MHVEEKLSKWLLPAAVPQWPTPLQMQPHAALTIRSISIGLINALICQEGLLLFRRLLHSFEYSFKNRLLKYINIKVLRLKLILVSVLIIVAVISIPLISLPGDDILGFNVKFFKHALEWDYFIGVITFYLLTFFMWKKTN